MSNLTPQNWCLADASFYLLETHASFARGLPVGLYASLRVPGALQILLRQPAFSRLIFADLETLLVVTINFSLDFYSFA